MVRREAILAASFGVVVLATCSFDWDTYDPRLATTRAGGASGPGGDGGTVTAPGGGGGAGATGGIGGAGGDPPPVLVDRGLSTRYFIDEAGSGMQPSELLDSAPDPLALDIDYGDIRPPPPPMGGAGGTGGTGGQGGFGINMSFTGSPGRRGLTWMQKANTGDASESFSNAPKLAAFDGLTEATVECVVDIDDSGGNGACGRIWHLGVNSHGNLMLCYLPGELSFRISDSPREDWAVNLSSLGRVVLHAVFDSKLPDAEDRFRMFIDGVDRGAGTEVNDPPPADHAIAVSSGRFMLGNRIATDASVLGVLHYCAAYTVALTPEEITNNAALLAVSDDRP